ncbi:hypothetical protein [Parabacteroides sp. PF5-9]|uniref:hypothetical protein n=1 Tax=Parabacteroides sp. PF5-9 TaxID=1742404 RepID=UPI002473AE8B|nr:hypothetical protein [Parabacteroides sp. PF5-9]MDH6357092.1 hypothetical protein [Parabacteroides sp. PF5-9]
MNKVSKRLDNQAIGLVPLLLFMFLDNYISYLFSLAIGAAAFFVLTVMLYLVLKKDKIYQFMLLPAAATLSLYALFVISRLDLVLFSYSPIVIEVLLVVVLAIIGSFKRTIIRRIRHSANPKYRKSFMRATINEFYFLVQIVQNLYTLHLFIILFYSILPDTMQHPDIEHFLFRQLGLIIGVVVIIYEQIRLTMMQGSLRKEMWLPVLNNEGKVIGCIARSVSRSLPRKYYHPIVRVAVIYEGKLYLSKRNKEDYISPDTLDYPFHQYVTFRHSIDQTMKETIGELIQDKRIAPHMLIRYTYEDEKVKHMVSLYTIRLCSEEQLKEFKFRDGKLWTAKQIEENINSGVFSKYFETEFPYLQNTILFAENFCNNLNKKDEDEIKSVI